ncbi:MAG: hypothetical protein AB1710_01710 [Pseudomonadota bacterium]
MENFDFGKRLLQYIDEVMNYGGSKREESDLTDGQRVFLHAVRRELLKYTDPDRQGYPRNALEQMQSFCRTVGDLHNSYFDSGHRKISDCLYKRWGMLYEETQRLSQSGAANLPCWVDASKNETPDMPAFFDV